MFTKIATSVLQRIETGFKIRNSMIWKDENNLVPLMASSMENAPFQAKLSLYICGPTVYAPAHLGHARAYISTDVIQRAISAIHPWLNVHTAIGITDIDDKILNVALNEKCSWRHIAQCYETSFLKDYRDSHIRMPSAWLRVSEHINQIREMVKQLLEQQLAYSTEDGSVYFNVMAFEKSSLDPYICFGHESDSDAMEDGNVKKDKRDFALWKAVSNAHSDACWPHPFDPNLPPGRPGWHIECSAMTLSYFGSWLDCHAGGIDLKFPHHTNELAQCRAYLKSEWCNQFLHTGHVQVAPNVKMAKSDPKSVVTWRQLLDQYGPNILRLFLLATPYTKPLLYSPERVLMAEQRFQLWQSVWQSAQEKINTSNDRQLDLKSVYAWSEHVATWRQQSISALQDNFDVPRVLQEVDSQCRHFKRDIASISACVAELWLNEMKWICDILGLQMSEQKQNIQNSEIVQVQQSFLTRLKSALDSKDDQLRNALYKACDDCRQELRDIGIEVRDNEKIGEKDSLVVRVRHQVRRLTVQNSSHLREMISAFCDMLQ